MELGTPTSAPELTQLLSPPSPASINSYLLRLTLESLNSCKGILEDSVLDTLSQKYDTMVITDHRMQEYLEQFIYTLINELTILQQNQTLTIFKEDYQVLEEAVQKSQAEIRKHIRVEQQLKIYMDSLEEKVQTMEDQLTVQKHKYQQLFETMRDIENQRKQLAKKVNSMEEGRTRSGSKHNLGFGYETKGPIAPQTRSKPSIQKSGDKIKKPDRTRWIEGSNIQVGLHARKKASYDHGMRPQQGQQSQIGQLTKTVQMKQPQANHYQRRINRKASRQKTEGGGQEVKRRMRCHSVYE